MRRESSTFRLEHSPKRKLGERGGGVSAIAEWGKVSAEGGEFQYYELTRLSPANGRKKEKEKSKKEEAIT